MNTNRKWMVVATLIAALLVSAQTLRFAQADPCGMVPPIYQGDGPPIVRIGLQKTYVFYKDGVETFVIRPGFSGKVEEFGMLIPFPAVPSLRKVPDDIFAHIANAIDPPEVVIDVRPRFYKRSGGAGGGMGGAAMAEPSLEVFRRDEVKVIKQEAVGMYEVAVLAAGSAEALKKWMDANGFRYPDGMEPVTEEYIADKWCFVAVKTKVAEKSGVDPSPGQRKIDDKLENQSSFDGFVQAMGFRFHTDEILLPMRLSTFNEGDLRNVVYILSDDPQRISQIDERLVVRQISGEELFNNVTKPLPLRIIGGGEKDIPRWQRETLESRRAPGPKNGFAMNLFSSDLLAVASDKLSLRHEESEKALLRIGEYLQLRGAEIDKLNAAELSKQIEKTNRVALEELKGMTLSVVDGSFPRKLLADENLKFAEFHMADDRNKSLNYDAKTYGPGGRKTGNLIETGMLPRRQLRLVQYAAIGGIPLLIVAVAIGLVRCCWHNVLLIVASCSILSSSAAVSAAEPATADNSVKKAMSGLLDEPDSLTDPVNAISKLAALADRNKRQRILILRNLNMIASGRDLALKKFGWEDSPADTNLLRRGWAIAALSQIDGLDSDAVLLEIHSSESQPMLVRTWAAAARIELVDSTAAIIERASLLQTFPTLERPIGKRLLEKMQEDGDQVSVEDLIRLSNRTPQLERVLASPILAVGALRLAETMTKTGDDMVRRKAAAYLGSLAAKDPAAVAEAVNDVYTINPMAKEVPWNGGALYIPGIQWTKATGTPLVGNLIAWHVWCEEYGDSNQQQQIQNNLRSISLSRAVGYQEPSASNAIAWLTAWSAIVGKEGIVEMLETLNVSERAKYRDLIESL